MVEQDRLSNPKCVFWDLNGDNGRGDWSSKGCRLSDSSKASRPVCRCRRLAHFAVLLDVRNEYSLPLQFYTFTYILTYIGCGASIFGLILTIAAYASSPKLRKKQPNQILLCLSTTMVAMYCVFVLVASLGNLPSTPCAVLAALLHFFVLSSLAWMGVEGMNVYLLLVRVIDLYIPKFVFKAAFFAWGLPGVIVLVVGIIFRENYVRTDLCFMSRWPQVAGLLVPVAIIMAVNIVIFIRVMHQLNMENPARAKSNLRQTNRHRERIRRLRNACIIILLLGLAWVFGFISNIPRLSPAFQVIFVLLNAFQGFYIFMAYCLGQAVARKQLTFSCSCLPFTAPSATWIQSWGLSSSSPPQKCDANENAPQEVSESKTSAN
ncbi:adhesion G-protein coupled receptor G2-like [Diadema antillarum]|uniref:adhesion G-protein coupled receptor G2-like n=1 Tax=Diadema antillarum TaxID=105358 RepID=UPI003A8950A8